MHLPFLSSYSCESMPSSWLRGAHTPLCIAIRLPFVSQYFCKNIRVRGPCNNPSYWLESPEAIARRKLQGGMSAERNCFRKNCFSQYPQSDEKREKGSETRPEKSLQLKIKDILTGTSLKLVHRPKFALFVFSQESREVGFSKGGFCRIQSHGQENKPYPRMLDLAVHLTLRTRQPREA